MAYNYKYIPSSIAASAKKGKRPKDDYINLFQQTLKDQFYSSSDWWTVEEETYVGSNIFEETDVRISHVINAETGLKLGDDWKTIMFQDLNHVLDLGKKYRFDNNTWIVINIEVIKNLAATCTIRRCNNTLRWIDGPTGVFYQEPCCIEYEVKEPRDYATQGSPFMTPGGFLHVTMQLNPRSAKINENQRFLFGNALHWTAYKVTGTGINDFRNTETYDNDSAQILTLDLTANFINEETDDIVNGIADVYTNVYHVTLSSGSIGGLIGGSFQLSANVIYNNDIATRQVQWASSNIGVAYVSGSGFVSFLSNGSSIITASVYGNPASASCLAVVSTTPVTNSEIIISPTDNYVLEGDSETYAVYLYENNILQADTFVFTCNGNTVPSTSYSFVQNDGNHFTISNILRDVNSYLTIQCTSASVAPKYFDIYLRGAWKFNDM